MGRALLYALATQREESARVLIGHRASLDAVNLCFLYASGPPSLVPSPELARLRSLPHTLRTLTPAAHLALYE